MMQEKTETSLFKKAIIPTITTILAILCFLGPNIALLLCLILPMLALYGDMKLKLPISGIIIFVIAAIGCALNWNDMYIYIPFILPTALLALGCYYIRKLKDMTFYEGLAYSAALSLVSVVIGVIIVFKVSGDIDLIRLYSDHIISLIRNAPSNSIINIFLPGFSSAVKFITEGSAFDELFEFANSTINFTRNQHLEIISPFLYDNYSITGASIFMKNALLLGLLTWYIPTVIFYRKIKRTKDGPMLKPPPFTAFRMRRWFTNSIMLLLVVVLFMQFSVDDSLFAASIAIEKSILLVLSIQGLSTCAWIFKKNKFPIVFNVLLVIIIGSLGSIAAWIGVLDIVFNFRLFLANKQNIKKTIELAKMRIREEEDARNETLDEDNNIDDEDNSDDERKE